MGYLAFAFLHDPAPGEPTVCLFRNITGLPCPSCGLSHGLHALFLGQWRHALELFPLAPLYALGFLFFSALFILEALTGKILMPAKTLQALGWSALGLILAVWLGRLFSFCVCSNSAL